MVSRNSNQKNTYIFKTFYSELAGNLVKKLPKPPLKFNSDNMMFYKKIKSKFREIRIRLCYGKNQ